MLNTLKILYHQGKQFIPDPRKANVPGIFRGRPEISFEKVDEKAMAEVCPTNAISVDPVGIDLENVLSVANVQDNSLEK